MRELLIAAGSGGANPGLSELIALLIGALLTYGGVVLHERIARRTHTSNRLFELRVEALNNIWRAFNEMKGWFAFRMECGYAEWVEEYRDRAREALGKFRRAVDNSQVVLDSKVVDSLRKLDEAYFLYCGDEEARSGAFQTVVQRMLKELTDEIDAMFASDQHRIVLKLRT